MILLKQTTDSTMMQCKAQTISTMQFHDHFPDEAEARAFVESAVWGDIGPTCPKCGSLRHGARKAKLGRYRCKDCRKDYSVIVGTVFEQSHIGLRHWLYAIYLLQTARKGISSLQLSKELGITQKSAWFLLHRLREACGSDVKALGRIAEMDTTYLGREGK